MLTGYFYVDNFHELEKEYESQLDLDSNDVLLLCSDRLYDELPIDEWLSVGELSMQEWLLAMLDKLKIYKTFDNVSMILIQKAKL